MKQRYAQYVKTIAKPGKRDELIQQLEKNIEMLKDAPDCIYYLITTTEHPDEVCALELWTSKEAKDAFAARPDAVQAMKDAMSQLMPLVASMGEQSKMSVVGGVGVE